MNKLERPQARQRMRSQLKEWLLAEIETKARDGYVSEVFSLTSELIKLAEIDNFVSVEGQFKDFIATYSGGEPSLVYDMMLEAFVDLRFNQGGHE